ncbi:MAG: hypothetical protein WCQ00_02260 [bacterium]
MKKISNQKGFIEIIVVLIIALVLLNVLGIDLKAVLAKDSVKQFITYAKDLIVLVWNDLKMLVDAIKNSNVAPSSYPTVN